MSATARAINFLWKQRSSSVWRRVHRGLVATERLQLRYLKRHLARNAATAFGRAHGFDRIGGLEAFRRAVPVRDYMEMEPWISDIAEGASRVLTSDEVGSFLPTSGTRSARKYVPVTDTYLSELRFYASAWMAEHFRRVPAIARGPAYWSLSPIGEQWRGRHGRIPLATGDDRSLLGGSLARLLGPCMAVPPQVVEERDWQFATAAALLAQPDLAFVSVWHPSFFTALLDRIERSFEDLLPTVRSPRRRRQVERAGPGRWSIIWPHLAAVSCWCDASAGAAARSLAKRLPQARFLRKGLLACEGVISIPHQGRCLALPEPGLLEFKDDDGRCHLLHELQVGASYEVLLTNGSGLCRYRLGDRVRVDSLLGSAPAIRFLGRSDEISDLVGEKLHAAFIGDITNRLVEQGLIGHAILAAESDGYVWLVDEASAAVCDRFEAMLHGNPHYRLARAAGQLRPLRVIVVADLLRRYMREWCASGRRFGDAKLPSLMDRQEWQRWKAVLLADRSVSEV